MTGSASPPPVAPKPKRWEIGVARITDTRVRWTGEFVEATDEAEALRVLDGQGFYRNVRVREEA